ncbi:hypothetical protein JD844_032895, partial [Phrynosoma platyrhinos]
RRRYISSSSDDGLSTYSELAKEEAGEISKVWNCMVDTISAEPPVMQQPGGSSGSAETEKCAEPCGGSPLPTALWKLANIGRVDIPESVDMATTQPSNVVMAEILGLEVGNGSSNFSPRELKVLMSSLTRSDYVFPFLNA